MNTDNILRDASLIHLIGREIVADLERGDIAAARAGHAVAYGIYNAALAGHAESRATPEHLRGLIHLVCLGLVVVGRAIEGRTA